jgi:hypothetical protein
VIAAAVIASEAKQSSFGAQRKKLDCFVARAPRNDERGLHSASDQAIAFI